MFILIYNDKRTCKRTFVKCHKQHKTNIYKKNNARYNGKNYIRKRPLLKAYYGGKKYMRRIMHGYTGTNNIAKRRLLKACYGGTNYMFQINYKTKYIPVNMLL